MIGGEDVIEGLLFFGFIDIEFCYGLCYLVIFFVD